MKGVVKRFTAGKRTEGAGFVVRRPIGDAQLSDVEADPFLLLDELPRTRYAPGEFPGAPWHPHRGFDTVMYIKEGRGDHEDSLGNKGSLESGDCQWMTAGSGILHHEGANHPGGWMHGFQCWVNLPRAEKMCDPGYQDIKASLIPEFHHGDKVHAKVIAGRVGDIQAVCQTKIPVQYIDFILHDGGNYAHVIPREMETVIAYVYNGRGNICGQNVGEGDTLLLTPAGDHVELSADAGLQMSMLLLAGQPLREPIARYGPFVMNTKAEIQQAFQDYQRGELCKVKGKMRSL